MPKHGSKQVADRKRTSSISLCFCYGHEWAYSLAQLLTHPFMITSAFRRWDILAAALAAFGDIMYGIWRSSADWTANSHAFRISATLLTEHHLKQAEEPFLTLNSLSDIV